MLSYDFFSISVVHGQWSEWGGYTTCTKTCGTGNQIRIRTCTNPPPSGGGNPCGGSSSQSRDCNDNACPGAFL